MRVEYLPRGSPDCPLIRIYGHDKSGMLALRAAVSGLAEGKKTEVDLAALPSFEMVENIALKLIVAKTDGIRRQRRSLHFEWALDAGGWATVASLIDPLIAQPNRYQWLYDQFGKIKVLLSAYEDGQW